MAYTGTVRVGEPAQTRELSALVIRKMAVSEMSNNVYLLTCARSGSSLLIDAADDAPAVLGLVAEAGGSLDQVLTTHRHWDHVRALATVLAETGARALAGEADADHLPVPPDIRLTHDDAVQVGEVTLRVVGLRGHTPGSVALAYDDPDGSSHLFTGDSLFPGGVGRTWSPEDFDSLITDVNDRVFGCYGDSTWVYPGHGGDTTLGAERPHLPDWLARGW